MGILPTLLMPIRRNNFRDWDRLRCPLRMIPYYQRMYMNGTSNISYVDTTNNTVVDTSVGSGFLDGLTFNASWKFKPTCGFYLWAST